MPQRQVNLSAGPGFTSIFATIPLHYLKIWKDDERNTINLVYRLPNDNFTATYTTDSSMGDIIERVGPGRHGLLGHQAAFSASGQTATELIRMRASDNSVIAINIFESETNL